MTMEAGSYQQLGTCLVFRVRQIGLSVPLDRVICVARERFGGTRSTVPDSRKITTQIGSNTVSSSMHDTGIPHTQLDVKENRACSRRAVSRRTNRTWK